MKKDKIMIKEAKGPYSLQVKILETLLDIRKLLKKENDK